MLHDNEHNEVGKGIPDIAIQRDITKSMFGFPLVVRETRYLIARHWMEKFKSYVGLQDCNSDDHYNHPGPIDNSPLFDDIKYKKSSKYSMVHWRKSTIQQYGFKSSLMPDLIENLHFIAVIQSLWILLKQWYGLMEDQEPIPRKVINVVNLPKCIPKLEVYLVELSLYENRLCSTPTRHHFSQADKMSTVEEYGRSVFQVPKYYKVEMQCFYGRRSSMVNNKSSTIFEQSECKEMKIVFDITASVEPIRASPVVFPITTIKSLQCRVPLIRTRVSGINSYPGTSSTVNIDEPIIQKGACGLFNMGNTCYMNSIFQCLSNCEYLTEYFLNNRHVCDIAMGNLLGSRGKLASSYGDLIKNVWSGNFRSIVPEELKREVERIASQFYGNSQHDAQEYLTVLLNALHEDLSWIKIKPGKGKLVADSKEGKIAQETWNSYKRQNDSIIIDTFYGMLASGIKCHDCEIISYTFDPFNTVSLPLDLLCNKKVRLVPYDLKTNIMDINLSLPIKGCFGDIRKALERMPEVKPEFLVYAEVKNSFFLKFFSDDNLLDEIDDNLTPIYVYDIPIDAVNNTSMNTIVPVVLWEQFNTENLQKVYDKPFGIPFLVILPRPVALSKIYELVSERLRRYYEHFKPYGCLESYINLDAGTQARGGSNAEYIFELVEYNVMESVVDTEKLLENKSIFLKLNSINCFVTDFNTEITLKIPVAIGSYQFAVLVKSQMRIDCFKNPVIEQQSGTPILSSVFSTKATLINCLDVFLAPEALGGSNSWNCPSCKIKKTVTKKLDFWTLPNIIIFHLKRFRYGRSGIKCEMKVDFPLTGLDINKYVSSNYNEDVSYDLIGVTNHIGSLSGGHYTATCKNFLNQKWYHFDDNFVTEVLEENVETNEAYLLFYQKRSEGEQKTLEQPKTEDQQKTEEHKQTEQQQRAEEQSEIKESNEGESSTSNVKPEAEESIQDIVMSDVDLYIEEDTIMSDILQCGAMPNVED